MNDTALEIQLFYELATAIGNSSDLELMAKEALSAYLRKLNCSSGALIMVEVAEEGVSKLRPIVTIPRKVQASVALDASLRQIPTELDARGCEELCHSLPRVILLSGGKYGHLMPLHGFGLLLLVKAGTPFEESTLKSLTRLNAKLTQACLVCLQAERTAKMNEALKREIEERLRAEAALQRVLDELESRVAERTRDLVEANTQLREALANVKMLRGLLPICSVCKKVRDDQGYWNQIESYIASHSEAMFTHGICPECTKSLYPEITMPQ